MTALCTNRPRISDRYSGYRPVLTGALLAGLWTHAAAAAVPDREWGTYVGGESAEGDGSVVVDGDGNVYLCGATALQVGITTPGVHQPVHGGGDDAYLLRLTPEGEPVWGTYFGGPGGDTCRGLAVDGAGHIVIFGNTSSDTGIATPGAVQPNLSKAVFFDGYVAMFDTDGGLLWSTYIGSSATFGGSPALSAAFDANGAVHVAGLVLGPLPFALPGPHDTEYSGNGDTYLIKFAPDGTMEWGTYYGGNKNEGYVSVAAGEDVVYLVGGSESDDAMTTADALDPVQEQGEGFVARFGGDGVRQWGTYYGGLNFDNFRAAVVTSDGVAAYGSTRSNGLATPDAHQIDRAGTYDGLLVRLDTTGGLQWATYIGGPDVETGFSVIADPAGNLLVAGTTRSLTDLATPGSFQPDLAGLQDQFLVKFDPAGARLWGTYLGGAADEAYGGSNRVAVDGLDTLYYAAATRSVAGIATANSFQPVLGGDQDNFLMRLTQICDADADCGDDLCIDGECIPAGDETEGETSMTTGDETRGTTVDETDTTVDETDTTVDETDTTVDTSETSGSTSTDPETSDTTAGTGEAAEPSGDGTAGTSQPAGSTTTVTTAPEPDEPTTSDTMGASGSTTAEPPAPTSSTSDSDEGAGEPAGDGLLGADGCNCATGPRAPTGLLAALMLLARRRRPAA